MSQSGYIGIAIAVCIVVPAIIYFVVSRAKARKTSSHLDSFIQSFHMVSSRLQGEQNALRQAVHALPSQPSEAQIHDLTIQYRRLLKTIEDDNRETQTLRRHFEAEGKAKAAAGMTYVTVDHALLRDVERIVREYSVRGQNAPEESGGPAAAGYQETAGAVQGVPPAGGTPLQDIPKEYGFGSAEEQPKRRSKLPVIILLLAVIAGVAVAVVFLLNGEKSGPGSTSNHRSAQATDAPGTESIPETEADTEHSIEDIWTVPEELATEVPETLPPAELPSLEPGVLVRVYTNEDKDVIMNVQRMLNELGYPDISVDGDAGEKTKAAIREFRSQYGLEVNDDITDELIQALEAVLAW